MRGAPAAEGTALQFLGNLDADEVLVTAYLDYWPQVADFSMKAPDALIQMMQLRTGFLANLIDAMHYVSETFGGNSLLRCSLLIYRLVISLERN